MLILQPQIKNQDHPNLFPFRFGSPERGHTQTFLGKTREMQRGPSWKRREFPFNLGFATIGFCDFAQNHTIALGHGWTVHL